MWRERLESIVPTRGERFRADLLGKFVYVLAGILPGAVVVAAISLDPGWALLFAIAAGWGSILLVRSGARRRAGRPHKPGRKTAGQAGAEHGRENHVDSLRRTVEQLAARLAQLEAEASLREQILSSMGEGVILLDRQGNRVYANPAAESLLGTRAALPPGVAEGHDSEFTTRHPEHRLRAASSTMRDGGRLIVIQDVTEAWRLDQMRRDFVANVSHELKTPVAGILASAETLELAAYEDPSNVEKFAGSHLREAKRLSKLVNDLLDLARVETEISPFEPVDLTSIVHAEIARVADFVASKSLDFESQVAPGVGVRGNPEDLTLSVRNLLVNAVRYTERGAVTAALARRESAAVFSVTDTGLGIPAKDLPRIFERFYRVDKARSRETGGTGLGLAIVKHIAERHGGDLTAQSELGRGSTFTLTLPLGDSQVT